jgi:hypothetical protein
MSDEFDRRDWAEDLNDGIRNRDTWFRGLKIVVLLLFLAIARFALLVTVAYQFCFCMVRNRPSEIMLPVGRWLASYVEESILFMTWNSDFAPFPFSSFNKVTDPKPDNLDQNQAYETDGEYYAGDQAPFVPEPPEPPEPPASADEIQDEEPGEEPPTADTDSEDPGESDDIRPGQPPRPDA